jgi:glycosyltransferase involved in cell wall biosynthesis
MRLVIVSHTPHYRCDSHIVGWGATVREIDSLAQEFAEIRHIACLHSEPAPRSALPYTSNRIQFVPIPPAGGKGLWNKLGIIRLAPCYIHTLLRELRHADLVHVRCPSNISLIAIMLLALVRYPRLRWVKYAGNWQPDRREARSYTLQRWWLARNLHRGLVTVNGSWPEQSDHIYSFLNPCLTDTELAEAHGIAHAKQLSQPIHLLYVGRLETAKGVGRTLQILALLRQRSIGATLELVGDGPERQQFERQAVDLGIESFVTFHGWIPRPALAPLFAQAHILLFPSSSSEGWPKVLSEGMAYGVVPIAGSVSSIPEYLTAFGTGKTCDPDDPVGFGEAIAAYASDPALWKAEAQRAAAAAAAFSYTNYLAAVRDLLQLDQTG